jgi:hypothetical protein
MAGYKTRGAAAHVRRQIGGPVPGLSGGDRNRLPMIKEGVGSLMGEGRPRERDRL